MSDSQASDKQVNDNSTEPTQYPLLPLRDVVVFPHMVIPLFVGRPKSIKAMETAMESGKSILLVAQKSAAKDDPGPEDMYEIGCISNILQMLKLPDGTVKVLVEGGSRARIGEITDLKSHWVAESSGGLRGTSSRAPLVGQAACSSAGSLARTRSSWSG